MKIKWASEIKYSGNDWYHLIMHDCTEDEIRALESCAAIEKRFVRTGLIQKSNVILKTRDGRYYLGEIE